MMKTFKAVFVVSALAFAAGIASPVFAQSGSPNSAEKLQEINGRIQSLTTELEERASSYPDLITELRANREKIDSAEGEIDQMIADLGRMTDEMDINSELHGELTGLDNQILGIVAQLEQQNDPALKDLLDKMKARRTLTQDLDKRRARSVINARETIRDLEQNKERLVLVKQIGAIDAAIEILRASIEDFEEVVKSARAIADDVTTVVASP